MNRRLHTIRLTFAGSFGVLLVVMMVFAGLLTQLNRLAAKESHIRSGIGSTGQSGHLTSAPSVTRPGQPLRYKRAAFGKRHFAPMRFQHMRAKTAKLCSVVAFSPSELRSLLPAAPDLAATSAGHRTTGARAPPFA